MTYCVSTISGFESFEPDCSSRKTAPRSVFVAAGLACGLVAGAWLLPCLQPGAAPEVDAAPAGIAATAGALKPQAVALLAPKISIRVDETPLAKTAATKTAAAKTHAGLLDPAFLDFAPVPLAKNMPLAAKFPSRQTATAVQVARAEDAPPMPVWTAAAPETVASELRPALAAAERIESAPKPLATTLEPVRDEPMPAPRPVERELRPVPAAAESVASAPRPSATALEPVRSEPAPMARPADIAVPENHVPARPPGRQIARHNRTVVPATAAADNRGLWQKFFGAPQSPGQALAYAAPDDGAFGNGRRFTSGAALPYDRQTAVYDIAAHTVYLPDGSRLEAHSGLGSRKDDPRYVDERMRGATPPQVYELKPREQLFHGVRALRLTPVGTGSVYGRVGLLAHTYMLGPRGDSNGCVSFRNYNAFLRAYENGEVRRLAVVAHL